MTFLTNVKEAWASQRGCHFCSWAETQETLATYCSRASCLFLYLSETESI